MDQQRLALRSGAASIALSIVLRLAGGGFFQPLAALAENPQLLSWLVYVQTGRVAQLVEEQVPSEQGSEPDETEASAQTQETPAAPTEPERPSFTQADAETVPVRYGCSYRPDIAQLLTAPLSWDLTIEEPTVLIVHTHATESYTRAEGESYVEDTDYRTLDEGYNMLSIGDRVAEILEAAGIGVIHDRSLHDYPSYSGSYSDARSSIEQYLSDYPSIRVVLDIHRDAAELSDGSQMSTATTIHGVSTARVMILVGTDASGGSCPNWEENLGLGLKLAAMLERDAPGITRYVNLSAYRLNMDLTPGSLLLEIGSAGDSHAQALAAAEIVAQALAALKYGSE
ncbi:MAG: stage II sporulation protein P [Firmicutes bacterium]|nr:stage II sporulation protein P [Bacillota bacterium]